MRTLTTGVVAVIAAMLIALPAAGLGRQQLEPAEPAPSAPPTSATTTSSAPTVLARRPIRTSTPTSTPPARPANAVAECDGPAGPLWVDKDGKPLTESGNAAQVWFRVPPGQEVRVQTKPGAVALLSNTPGQTPPPSELIGCSPGTWEVLIGTCDALTEGRIEWPGRPAVIPAETPPAGWMPGC
jgi:hypothetical protein